MNVFYSSVSRAGDLRCLRRVIDFESPKRFEPWTLMKLMDLSDYFADTQRADRDRHFGEDCATSQSIFGLFFMAVVLISLLRL